jgi:beta-glucanase (GH16 family)
MRLLSNYRKLSLIFFGMLLLLTTKAQVGQIIWQENFNTLNTDIWNTVTGDGCGEGPGCGWGNQELEYYHGNNVAIEAVSGEPDNNALVLQAKREAMGGSEFTSGKITTENKMAIKYGLIEVRMKTPNVETGLWPAAWLLGTTHSSVGWPYCGEIDMMEMGQSAAERTRQGYSGISPNRYVGSNLLWYSTDACSVTNPTCAASIAYDTYYDKPYVPSTGLNDRFAIYRLYWDDKSIRFTVEDNGFEYDLYESAFPIGAESSAFQKPFYMLLNLAVGGSFTDATNSSQVTAPLPAKMYVDYIRVRKWNGKGEVTLPTEIMANAGIDQTVAESVPVILNASGSYGDINNYVWTENGTQIATGINPTVNLTAGTHLITLTVSASNGNTATDQVFVQVGTSLIGEVIWEDNFDSFNTGIWNTVTGDGCEGESGCGFGNQELQYYNGNNIYIEPISGETGNNALVLEAKQETTGDNQFTSGKITTVDKLAIKYGVIDIRMKVPNVATGLWPAAWLLGVSHSSVGWPYCGEMDMMEMGHKASERTRQGSPGVSANNFVGSNLIWYTSAACAGDNPTCAASIAYDVYYDSPYTPASALNNRFVTYRMYWDEASIRFTVIDNDVEHDLYTGPFPIGANETAFQQPFYFIANLAVGGNFTDAATPGQVTAPLPAKLLIDYIKVRRWKGKGEVSYKGGNILANAGVDQSITDFDKSGNEMVTLNASGSYGSISSYVWNEGGAQLATGANPSVNLLNGDHYITLTTTDSIGRTSTDEVHIEVREIVWEDNFNTVDASLWNTIEGDGCSTAAGCGWGNQELEYYHGDNVKVEAISGEAGNNALVLEAKQETMGSSQFTSGKITTENKLSIKYGLLELRMKSPDVQTGLWPAAWMLGINQSTVGWPHCGEIDMMEMGQSTAERTRQGYSSTSPNNYVGSNLLWYSPEACSGTNPTCAASIAYDTYYDKPYVPTSGLNNRFVIYRLYWNDASIRFTVEDNGTENDLYTGPFPIGVGSSAFQQPFYFLLNLAVGGSFTDATTPAQVTAPLPGKMLIDYVRLMKWKGKGEVAFGNGLVANAGPDAIVLDKDKNGLETAIMDASGSTDFNGSITNYSWKENEIEIATGVMPSIDLSRGIHTIALIVTDNDGNTATDNVIVTVTSGGSSPVAVAGNDTTLYDDNGDDLVSFTLDASGSSDPNDSPLTYSWEENSTVIATGVDSTVNFNTGIHTVTLIVTNEDSISSSDEIIITVIDPDNNAPVVNAGPDQTINDNDGDDMVSVTLDASGSSDSDGTINNYSWKEKGLEIATGVSPTVNFLTGVHEIILEATDNDGVSSFDTVSISIIDPDNLPPIANAGSDTLIVDIDRNGTQSFTLDGSGSTDSDGTIAGFSWLENDSVIASANTSVVNLAVGLHTITLIATDNDGVSGSDTVLVKVSQKPIANAGLDTLVIDTNSDGSELVTLDGSGSSDPFGSIVSYSWKETGTEIAIGETTTYSFAKGTHVITLVVTDDDGLTAFDEVSVIVASINNIAPTAVALSEITVTDSDNDGTESVELSGIGSSDTDGSIYSYEWLEDGSVIATGVTSIVDFSVGVHTVILKVTDNEGATATATIVVTVKHGVCIYEACTDDYTAKVVSSEDGTTTIKFIPSTIGTGDQVCLLYIGTDLNAAFPGNIVTPYQLFNVTGVAIGQTVYFYYTYSRATGGEQNTNSCKHSFVVGDCFAGNLSPVANAGADTTIKIPVGTASTSVNLNGSGSSDADGTISSYVWVEGIAQIATGVNPAVTLSTGSHTISLIVTDNSGESARDKVVVSVINATGIVDLSNSADVKLYPSPVSDVLNVISNQGEIEKLQVYNSYGVKVLVSTSVSQVNMGALKEGLYFIAITIDGKTIIRKVIKI